MRTRTNVEEVYRKIEIRNISPTNVPNSNNDLYAVLYMDRDCNCRKKIDFNNANGSNPTMEFEVKESNINSGCVQLVIKLRRQRTFIDTHVGEVRVAIKDLFENRNSTLWGRPTISNPIMKSRWFGLGRPQQEGTLDITYNFGKDTFLRRAAAPVRGHTGQILSWIAQLLAVISSIVTVISCWTHPDE
uniref:Uncharacterized protein n=1 Tax=Nelumbo nucifera TaxID=4432 RepID=A0A822Z7S4_NELNU|nr:TPA_asm: hypothetical protein HUJ06_013833 [Nelumbo nucifera]DAD39515.1 TPA_asm: hypothetical protein HUJ06_013838 [Nelumbo nucifera]